MKAFAAGLRFKDRQRRPLLQQLGSWSSPLAILLATAILAVALSPVMEGEVSSGLVFMLGIALIGATSGLSYALVSALAASVIFNVFLADPVLTFRMSTGEDLAPPVIFTLCAVVSGLLSGRLRDKTSELGESNLQLESLLETSRMLQAAPDQQAIQAALREAAPGLTGLRLSLFEIEHGRARPIGDDPACPGLVALADRALAGEAIVRGPAGVAYRLDGGSACVGALVVEEGSQARIDTTFLRALASLVGLALERARFASVIAENEANARTEELKSALLSSVSHDLRTPLTAISASASSLVEYGNRLDDETSRNLLQGIVDECARLNRFTANLLELSRLQSGSESLNSQVLSASDVIRAVVQRSGLRGQGHDIRLSMPGEEVLVLADTALFELALTNVIQNAIQYSAPGSRIEVAASAEGRSCLLTVTDEGRGIPESEQPRVFERFYRVKGAYPATQGSGLGLAIAKGFVEAFGGSIALTSPVAEGRGTSVVIRLPIVAEVRGL